MSKIAIEGESLKQVLSWPVEYFDELVLIDKPIVFNVGSAEVLGQFAANEAEIIVELAKIEGGGEGVLPSIARIAKRIAQLKYVPKVVCIVHAIDCSRPNLKLKAHLEKTGFVIKDVRGKGNAYYKEFAIT